jgi:hypothetical protein
MKASARMEEERNTEILEPRSRMTAREFAEIVA